MILLANNDSYEPCQNKIQKKSLISDGRDDLIDHERHDENHVFGGKRLKIDELACLPTDLPAECAKGNRNKQQDKIGPAGKLQQ